MKVWSNACKQAVVWKVKTQNVAYSNHVKFHLSLSQNTKYLVFLSPVLESLTHAIIISPSCCPELNLQLGMESVLVIKHVFMNAYVAMQSFKTFLSLNRWPFCVWTLGASQPQPEWVFSHDPALILSLTVVLVCVSVGVVCFSPFWWWAHPDRRRHCHWHWCREKRWSLHQLRLPVGQMDRWESLHSLLHHQPLQWVSQKNVHRCFWGMVLL